MVKRYARRKPSQTPQEYLRERPLVGRYASGPYDTIDEIQDRLATGIPLNGFEFQRIQRNLHLMRSRLTGVLPDNRTSEQLAAIEYLTALEEEALRLKPAPIEGRMGGLTGTELVIHKREYEREWEQRHGPRMGRSLRFQKMTPEERRESIRKAMEERRRLLAARQ